MITKFIGALLLAALTVLSVWAQAPATGASQTPDGIARITVEELKAKMDKNEKVVVVDVRAHAGSMIKGAVHIPVADIEKQLDKLPKDALIVTVCG